MPVTRCCPRCGAWHAVLWPCAPQIPDLTAWVAGTLRDQSRTDEHEARAIAIFRGGGRARDLAS